MMRRLSPHRRHGDGERGSIIVELAIVVPLLMTLLLGMFEITMAWRVTQTMVQGTRTAARTATQLGDNDKADQAALKAIEASFGDDSENIIRVVIWEVPQDASGFPTVAEVPAACQNAGGGATPVSPPSENCNVYGQEDIVNIDDLTRFDGNPLVDDGCGSGRSANWCPSVERTHNQQSATYVGIWIEYERDYVSHVLPGDSHRIRQSAIMRIEPKTSQ